MLHFLGTASFYLCLPPSSFSRRKAFLSRNTFYSTREQKERTKRTKPTVCKGKKERQEEKKEKERKGKKERKQKERKKKERRKNKELEYLNSFYFLFPLFFSFSPHYLVYFYIFCLSLPLYYESS